MNKFWEYLKSGYSQMGHGLSNFFKSAQENLDNVGKSISDVYNNAVSNVSNFFMNNVFSVMDSNSKQGEISTSKIFDAYANEPDKLADDIESGDTDDYFIDFG